ncbi:hypothetical protein BGZ61DRAFT_195720 [Ilyonectria robusta]|uniref:uncharacterized protein n=1 Tax=Ilyonectria robusta TaxID=1079257 RepID=UPI001E8CFD66|nr:uncharacterized protein BGZ61DRAFT_195720 [Ilyonectria robusta]KAH8721849.1 hypothetical protein BGZ61DRAFT_195720 [Ilyonectria robusta]
MPSLPLPSSSPPPRLRPGSRPTTASGCGISHTLSWPPSSRPLAAAVRHLRQSDLRSKAQPFPCSQSLPAYFCLFCSRNSNNARLNSSACGSVISGVWLSTAPTVLISLPFPPLPSATALFRDLFRSLRSLISHLLFPAVLFLVDIDEVVALGFQLFNLDPATALVQPLSNLFSTAGPGTTYYCTWLLSSRCRDTIKGKIHDEKLN